MTKQQLLDSLAEVPHDATIVAWVEGPVYNVRFNREANRIELCDVEFEMPDGSIYYEPVHDLEEVVDVDGSHLLYYEDIPELPITN